MLNQHSRAADRLGETLDGPTDWSRRELQQICQKPVRPPTSLDDANARLPAVKREVVILYRCA